MSPSPEKQPSKAQPYLPHYEVLEALGEGAVATVYKVRHVRNGSVRALKSLKPEQAGTPQAVKRFEDEFRILKRLHHPSLPEVFDYGITADGTRYIVMELVDGEPLDRYFEAHTDELWLLLYELTEALAFVHEHDLLHLDFKPDNALIKRTRAFGDRDIPMVTLIDFGLSYQRDVGGATGAVGTAHYMSPEMIRREEGLTRAADYYSLGCVLYELVEGSPPFDGNAHDILQKHLTQPVSFKQSKVEYADLYPWIERLMSKEPVARLEAFQEFRRTVATRQDAEIPALERAYALGYIESLGLIGKHRIWETLQEWSSGVQGGAPASKVEEEAVPKAPSSVKETDITLDTSVPDLKEAIRQDLLSEAAEVADITPDTAPRERKRYVALSGPRESGKSHMIETLRAELLPSGVAFVLLSDAALFDALLRGGIKKPVSGPVDPSAAVIDRFVTGWERLVEMARPSGVVVAVDDREGLPAETREFVEYVVKRIELLTSEGKEPGIFFVVADGSPGLKTYLSEVAKSETPVLPMDIPPPRTKDVDEVVSMFHGHMQGAEQRRSLAAYLGDNLETDGAVMMSLREAVADDSLKYEFGQWQFHEPSEPMKRRSSTSADYYRKVFPELMADSQTLVRWLCCHKGSLTQRQLEDLSLLDVAAVDVALGNIRPYRIVDVTTEGDDVRLAFVSEDVRQAFYGMLDGPERRLMHEAYVHYLEGYKDLRLGGMEALTYHYERAGLARDALLTRVRTIRKAKRKKDLNTARRSCNEGIAFVRGRDDKESLWHVERFFIKNLIDLEWSVNGYAAIIDLVKTHFVGDAMRLPLSFAPKYAFALDSAGDFEACGTFLSDVKARLKEAAPRTQSLISLAEASMLHDTQENKNALRVLEGIREESLSSAALPRYYVYLMSVHQALGNSDERERYAKLARDASLKAKDYELVVRVNYQLAMYLINLGKYEETKRILRNSIKIATRHRVYRGLATLYYVASGVYFEEDNYAQAIRYLDRAIRFSADTGMENHVNGYTLRYSINYGNLGHYGTAIRLLEMVKNRVRPGSAHRLFAVAYLFLLLNSINSSRASAYVAEIKDASLRLEHPFWQALSHQCMADHKFAKEDYSGALRGYATAVDFYSQGDYKDEVVKTKLSMAHTHIESENLREAADLIEGLSPLVARLNSNKIGTHYELLRLTFESHKESDTSDALRSAVSRCEARQPLVKDMSSRTKMSAALFRASSKMGDKERAIKYFRQYYGCVKQICSNLPGKEFVDDYMKNPEFKRLVEQFRSMS